MRVNDMAEIQSDSLYVIGAVLPADQCFYVLSSVVKNKRCVARRLGSAAETETSLTGVADAELWKIVRLRATVGFWQSVSLREQTQTDESRAERNSSNEVGNVGECRRFPFQKLQ